jgi:hypothetical protein
MKLELDRDDVRALKKALRYVDARMTDCGTDGWDLLIITKTEQACIEDILGKLEVRKGK